MLSRSIRVMMWLWVIVGFIVGIELLHQTPVLAPTASPTLEVELPSVTPTSLPIVSASYAPQTTTQYVVFSFDGSRDLHMWEETRAFAREQAALGAPVHFTYFISGVYFVDYAHRMEYQGPGQPAGYSPIGWADNAHDIDLRVQEIKKAVAEGHDIGSHANGHFDGSQWTVQQWEDEFQQFNHFTQRAFDTYDATSSAYPHIIGFRAPLLDQNPAMYMILASHGFTYDVSTHALHPTQPYRRADGIWEFPLPQIPYNGDAKRPLISMDYNFYYRQSGAKDLAKRGTSLWQQFYDDTLNSYRDYFNTEYNGPHIPVFISNHFSLWNDGVYWEAMKSFATEVCGKPQVKCVSFAELRKEINL